MKWKKKTPECGKWLEQNGMIRFEVSNAIVSDAMRIKKILGIVDDNYHPKGIGENDLLIIATAKAYGAELISDEQRQTSYPKESRKRKIPAVCIMSEVDVPCISFIDFIKRSDVVFG
jgi:hypothetical protein